MHCRPTYHFLPQKGWMNDPNGLIYFDGFYHLCYQYNPNGDHWGDIHWGHAKSRDLVHWEHLPPALAPSKEQGELHCFSGCTVIDNNTPTLFYTSVGGGERSAKTGARQHIAKSFDAMETFQKPDCNPVLTNEIHGETVVRDWRDPFVWRENNGWHMLLGGEIDGYGVIIKYSSQNLTEWTYNGTFHQDKDYPFLECPNLLRFGEKYVLIYSPNDKVVYLVGTIAENGMFVATKRGILDYGTSFYAPAVLQNDPKGRYIAWGWLNENSRGDFRIDGWRGALSVPRVLTLDDNGSLRQTPVEELQLLRSSPEVISTHLSGQTIRANTKCAALELSIDAQIKSGDCLMINVLQSQDNRELTTIRFDSATNKLSLDKGLTTLHEEPHRQFHIAELPEFGENLRLRIFIDVSIIEIFANESTVISGRVYPSLPDAVGISFDGNVEKLDAAIWAMNA